LSLASALKSQVGSMSNSSSEASTSGSVATSTAGSVEQAVDRVTGALRQQLKSGDLLVVWMIDASESLVDDRPRVSERLRQFFVTEAEEQRNGKSHILVNTLVSFGSRFKEHVPPTQSHDQVTAAIEKLPVDRTGKEFVFDAVQKCAEQFRKIAASRQLTLVIWTDESGDDVQELDETIRTCQKFGATVHVVGPSAVLGERTGYHAFTDPKTDEKYQLPVLRGPDSANIERLELGYWYFTPPPFRDGRRRRSLLPTWYGNDELDGMLSSFSPYSLTRLTHSTRGSYTILEATDDQGPFDLTLMQGYAPDYSTKEMYEQQFKTYPLRAAVRNAVRVLEGKNIDEPNRMFFIKKTGERQFDFDKLLYPESQFKSRYRAAVASSLQQAARSKKIVEEALAMVSLNQSIDLPMESEYREETSPRWRAWYDLTRGRLLAFHVRLEEFRLAAEATLQPGGLESTTNHVVFEATQSLRSNADFQRRGEEATKLLQRCIDQNMNTPWAYLSNREMIYALGVVADQSVLTPSKLSPSVSRPTLPKF
jgi:succinate dehydrogenase flavin-adding protein (antitoxin of CptAB toxin-antitoxin module)